jgi:hypothetical protein
MMKIWLPNWKREQLNLAKITPWSKFNPWMDCDILTESRSKKAVLIYLHSVGIETWMPKSQCSFRVNEDEQDAIMDMFSLEATLFS